MFAVFEAGELSRDGQASTTESAAVQKSLKLARGKLSEPWLARVEGAKRAAERRRQDRDRFIAANIAELSAELEPAALAAQTALVAALEAVQQVHGEWNRVARQFEALLPPLGKSNREIPSNPFDQLAVAAERMLAQPLPAPLPRALFERPAADSPGERQHAAAGVMQ